MLLKQVLVLSTVIVFNITFVVFSIPSRFEMNAREIELINVSHANIHKYFNVFKPILVRGR